MRNPIYTAILCGLGVIALVMFLTFVPILTCFGFVMLGRLMSAHWFFEIVFGLVGFILGFGLPAFAGILIYEMAENPKDSILSQGLRELTEKQKIYDEKRVKIYGTKEEQEETEKLASWLKAPTT